MIVDIHAHFVSQELIAEARRSGGAYGVRLRQDDGSEHLAFENGTILRPFFPELYDLALRMQHMDSTGVDVQVISTWMDIVGYWLPLDQARRWMRLQNDTLAQAVQSHPGRLRAMGTLPMQQVSAAIEELHYCVERLNMSAIQIGTSINGRALDEQDFRPFWARVREFEVFVFLHPPMVPMAPERLDRYFLANLMGNPMETTVAASRLIFGGVLDAYPGLKCCLAHAGGFLPYQVGRLDRGHQVRPECRAIAAQPSAYLDRFYYDTIAFEDRALAFLIQTVGPERVLFGSDFPFPLGDPTSLDRVHRVLATNDLEKKSVLGQNATAALSPLSG